MTEKMKAAFAVTDKLDPHLQDQIAERLLDIIDNEHWQELLHDPRSERFFDNLVAEDDAAEAGGDTGHSLDALLGEWDRQHGLTH